MKRVLVICILSLLLLSACTFFNKNSSEGKPELVQTIQVPSDCEIVGCANGMVCYQEKCINSTCGDKICDQTEDCSCSDCLGKQAKCGEDLVCWKFDDWGPDCRRNECVAKGWCCGDSDCEDWQDGTIDTCISPNTPESKCVHTPFTPAEYCHKTKYKMAFVIITDDAQVDKDLITVINNIKDDYDEEFSFATNELASIDTSYPLKIITTSQTNPNDLGSWTKEFYHSNPDDFDFITIFTTFRLEGLGFWHVNTIQNIKGLGGDLNIDITKEYGSNHKLLGINYGNAPDLYAGETKIDISQVDVQGFNRILLHETAHQWCCRVGQNLGISDGSHWTQFFEGSVFAEVSGSGYRWEKISETRFRRNGMGISGPQQYSPLMLYLMGLIPANEANFNYYLIEPNGPIERSDDFEHQYVDGKIKEYITIQDIINENGNRVCE